MSSILNFEPFPGLKDFLVHLLNQVLHMKMQKVQLCIMLIKLIQLYNHTPIIIWVHNDNDAIIHGMGIERRLHSADKIKIIILNYMSLRV